jgi:hypothetical protein
VNAETPGFAGLPYSQQNFAGDPAAAATPGQAAYESRQRSLLSRHGLEPGDPIPALCGWDRLTANERADEETGAQGAIDAATEGSLRACGYTLADVGRFLEAEAAAPAGPQAARGAADVNDLPVTPAAAALYKLASRWWNEAFRLGRLLDQKHPRALALEDASTALRAAVNDLRRDGGL